MDKQKLTAIIEAETEKIRIANETINQAKLDFIAANAVFKPGDKIKITTPPYKRSWDNSIVPETSRLAFVVKVKTNYYNDIDYVLSKCKKDGTQSLHTDYCGHSDILTLVERKEENGG